MTRSKALKGPELYCRVMVALKSGGKTRDEIAAHAGISRGAAYVVIDDLFSLQLVHVAGVSSRPLVFGFGPGANALPYMAPPARLSARVFGSVWKSLDAGPVSLGECMEETGRWYRSISTCIEQLRAYGLAHIESWERSDKGPSVAMYLIGDGADAPKPRKAGNIARCKRWRDRRKAREMQTAMLTAIRPDLILGAA